MKEVIQFLSELAEHNDKVWFEANKPRYRAAKEKIDIKINGNDEGEAMDAIVSFFS